MTLQVWIEGSGPIVGILAVSDSGKYTRYWIPDEAAKIWSRARGDTCTGDIPSRLTYCLQAWLQVRLTLEMGTS